MGSVPTQNKQKKQRTAFILFAYLSYLTLGVLIDSEDLRLICLSYAISMLININVFLRDGSSRLYFDRRCSGKVIKQQFILSEVLFLSIHIGAAGFEPMTFT